MLQLPRQKILIIFSFKKNENKIVFNLSDFELYSGLKIVLVGKKQNYESPA